MLADNGLSTDRLVYGDEPATVIAVGGNTLSRGLTLEGLVSSYFLRSSNTYDTLLQMGRWFGYRPGYGDLPRIWTTQELADDFEFLAEVEDALRAEIDRYRTMDGATPANLPVRIRLHPQDAGDGQGQDALRRPGRASFSAQRPQTTYFAHRDTRSIDANQSAARSLIDRRKDSGIVRGPPGQPRDPARCPSGPGQGFVASYRFHEDSEITRNCS